MSVKMDFGHGAVICLFLNDKSATAMLNNHKFDQGDNGYNPIILAAHLEAFLNSYGFKVHTNILPDTLRKADGKKFPRSSVVAQDLNKQKCDELISHVERFNELFAESATYDLFEATLREKTSPKPPTVLNPTARAFAPAPAATATTKSFSAAATANKGSAKQLYSAKTATAATPASAKPVSAGASTTAPIQETALQRKQRLKAQLEAHEAELVTLREQFEKARTDTDDETSERKKLMEQNLASLKVEADSRGINLEDVLPPTFLQDLKRKLAQECNAAAPPVPAAASPVPAAAPPVWCDEQ